MNNPDHTTETRGADSVQRPCSALPGDERIKAFCLRRGMAIPTDMELQSFPMEFRMFDGKTERLIMGCSLLRWMVKHSPNGPDQGRRANDSKTI